MTAGTVTVTCKYLEAFTDRCFYIKRVRGAVSTGEPHVEEEELQHAADWACAQVDACFGNVVIPTGSETPHQVFDAALMLASHKVLMMLLTSNVPKKSTYVEGLFRGAMAALKDITSGKKSLILRDGTVDPRYPGPTSGERYTTNDTDEQQRRYHVQPNKPDTEWDHLEAIDEAPEQDQFGDPLYTNP